MDEAVKEFTLRSGERIWATVKMGPDGKRLLCHSLGESELAMHPTVAIYEDSELLACKLSVVDGDPCVEFVDPTGKPKLRLLEGEDGELFELIDPAGDAELAVFVDDLGSRGAESAKEGRLVLRLRRIPRDPKGMS